MGLFNIFKKKEPVTEEQKKWLLITKPGITGYSQAYYRNSTTCEEKIAKLFFTLAACNPDEHLDNIQQLMDVFCNEPLLDALMEANTPEDILAAELAHPFVEEQF